MKYRIKTLGCRTNQYESEAYRAQLEGLGYSQAAAGEPADVVIVNTCTVTERADRDSLAALHRLVEANPGARIAATGCMIEGKELAIPGVTFVPNLDKESLVQRLFPELEALPEFRVERFAAQTRAFLKIQDGCNSFCTYCIIPYVRGRSRSRSVDEVVAEAEQLIANGYKEIVLTGINIGDFPHLAQLVRRIDDLPGLERLRISSIDPDEIDDDLLDAVMYGQKTCPSMHIVLQSGSNVVLKRMGRKYSRQIFLDAVERLRRVNPDFTVTTDVIVGFPGESERDFADTLAVMREVRFAKVHMFPYSARPRTRAALYPNQVTGQIVKARKERVLRISEQIAFELRQQFVGRHMQVLTENGASGHTANFLPVHFTRSVRPNTLVEVRLVENRPEGLVAA